MLDKYQEDAVDEEDQEDLLDQLGQDLSQRFDTSKIVLILRKTDRDFTEDCTDYKLATFSTFFSDARLTMRNRSCLAITSR